MINIKKWDTKDWLAFSLGLLMVVRIQIVGTFLASEFILLFLYPFTRKVPRKSRQVKNLHIFTFLWILGTIISNIENEINMIDFAKGVFFLVVLFFLIRPIYWLLVDKPERYVLFFIGSSLTNVLSPIFAQNEEVAEIWKGDIYAFYFTFAIFAGVAAFLFFKGRWILAMLIWEIAAIVGLFYNSRNLFLTSSISCILLIIILKNRKKDIARQVFLFKHRLLKVMFVLFAGLLLINFTYEQLVSNHVLGEDAYNKYVSQKEVGNALKGGRLHFFMGIELIKMKPIIGWGSYARDTWGFHQQYCEENGLQRGGGSDEDYLPAHSAVVGSWMQNGIFGGLFWFYVIFLVLKIVRSGCLLYEPRLLGLLIFLLPAQLWDWFFSPFGGRVSLLLYIILLFIIYNNYQDKLYPYSKKLIKQLAL